MKPRLQLIGGLWRCTDKCRFDRDRHLLKLGAYLPTLTPIGWDITPQEAYEQWEHFQRKEVRDRELSAQRSDLIGRAEGSGRARLKLIGETWLCVGGRDDLCFLIQGEGDTALQAYKRWEKKKRSDYLGRVVVGPWPEPASDSGWRLAAGIVSIVVGIALLIWAGLGALALATAKDSHPETPACLERSAAQ